MIMMLIKTCWGWIVCDKHILHTSICWSYYVNWTILLTQRCGTYEGQQSILATECKIIYWGIGCANRSIWLILVTKRDFNVEQDKKQNKKTCIIYKILQTIKHTECSVCHLLGTLGADTSFSSSPGSSTIWNIEV